jgi:hypothetical protein
MLIVYGVTRRLTSVAGDEQRLAQCHRCAMRNCRYRTAPADGAPAELSAV